MGAAMVRIGVQHFLLRQFFVTIPEELSEAARIDGCNELGIFLRIILPLSRPALAVIAIFTFMWAWRDFLGPLVYLQYPSQYTLSLGLQTFQSQNAATPWNQLMAASVLVIFPWRSCFSWPSELSSKESPPRG